MSRTRLRAVIALSFLGAVASGAEEVEGWCLATAPGECVQVTISGKGPDIVLIPGLFGSAFSFRRVTALLTSEGYRTIVIEPLGVGDSARPQKADYTLTAQADRIQAALETLDVKAAVLVSHSIGNSMALRLVYRHPEKVLAVISIEGGVAEEVATPGFRRAMKLAPLIKLFGASRIIRGKVRDMLVERSGDPAWVTEDIVRGYSAGPTRDTGATLEAFSQMSKAKEPELLAPRLGEVRCPVRLILGDAPHVGGPSEAEISLLSRSLKSFGIVRVPGAGHYIFEEAPAAVVDVVREITPGNAARRCDKDSTIPECQPPKNQPSPPARQRGGRIPVP